MLRSIVRKDGSIQREVTDAVALETPTTAAIGPSAAEALSTPLSDLTGAQVMEFAENNRGVDAQLDTILESTVPVGKAATQVRSAAKR